MFEPFFTTKDRAKHVGLDLAIAREIVEEHGGELKVTSQPGQWTRFEIDLPVSLTDAKMDASRA